MKQFFKSLCIAIFSLFVLNSSVTAVTVYTIGDSTMADYDPSVYPNQRGWVQMFKQFLIGDATCQNAARNGRSSKSFYTEGLWTAVLNNINLGDYVFIQFGHNDEKDNGASGDIGTTPAEYKTYLEKYVTETRSKGGIPVLITPLVRCYFSGNEITAKGAHNLSATGDDLNYPLAMKAVATDMNVDLIDHTVLTKTLVESYGATDAKDILYIEDDNTHLSIVGATLMARLVVQDLIQQDILTDNLNASPDILVNPGNIDFGNCYVGTFSSKSFTVSGMDLTPASGSITVTASDGFLVGMSETDTFSNSLTIDYTNGNLALTTVYVHFAPTEVENYIGTISVVQSSSPENPKYINLTGTALSAASGVPATVYFPLKADDSAIVEGPVISLGETYSKMQLNNYAAITGTWPAGAVTTDRTQRNVIESGAWPGDEIDIVPDRYIQFAVKPQPGTVFTIDSIGMYVGPTGGSGMGYRIMGSTSEDFGSDKAFVLLNKPTNTSGEVTGLSYNPILQVKDNETFYLRIYPWYSIAATGKLICLQNLMIKGHVTSDDTSTGIDIKQADNKISIYPNPVKAGCPIIVGIDNDTNARIQIYNIVGGLVREQFATAQTSVSAPTQAGTYIVKVLSDNDSKDAKLIVK